MGGHHSARNRSDIWLTPTPIIDSLGGWQSFDLDPCAAVGQPWRTARRHMTAEDNGLIMPWSGRTWLNPPYNVQLIRRFMARMAEHGNGVALIFARTETEHFHRFVWPVADAIHFFDGRITFHRPDGSLPEFDGGAPSVLIAYGPDNADCLAGSGLPGAFVPLKWRTFVAGFETVSTWARVVIDAMKQLGDGASLADIYAALASHPKAQRNPHWQAKIRQTLQAGPFERTGRGHWRLI